MPPIPLRRPQNIVRPYWTTTDGVTVRLFHGHVVNVLKGLPEKCIHCCVTSPPYWGLRDYSICGCRVHAQNGNGDSLPGNSGSFAAMPKADPNCKICGGTGKIKGMENQYGAEKVPDCLGWATGEDCGECFVCHTVQWTREVRRVLRNDGTLWLNLGDSYCGGGGFGGQGRTGINAGSSLENKQGRGPACNLAGGNLVGIPWRCALALQADGWILRQDVIWAKPAPMPESVRNRCTKAHEYVFLLTKGPRYYCDMEAIKENIDQVTFRRATPNKKLAERTTAGSAYKQSTTDLNGFGRDITVAGSNKRSVWTISSQGYPGAHFATYPPKLIEPMIKAGTSEKGCCAKCGAPWKRVVESTKYDPEVVPAGVRNVDASRGDKTRKLNGHDYNKQVRRSLVGWDPSCTCDGPVEPCVVLDPFVGSGTTCAVSLELGRYSVGVDLSDKYLRENAIPRVEGKARALGKGEGALLPRVTRVPVSLRGMRSIG